VAEPWPCTRHKNDDPVLVNRFWLDDDERWHWSDGTLPSPARAELMRQLAHRPRIAAAWDALLDTFRGGRDCAGYSIGGSLAGSSSLHERPAGTQSLHAEIVEGRDLAAECGAWRAKALADYLAKHPDAAEVSSRSQQARALGRDLSPPGRDTCRDPHDRPGEWFAGPRQTRPWGGGTSSARPPSPCVALSRSPVSSMVWNCLSPVWYQRSDGGPMPLTWG
jgi:hypothetical protein